MSDEEDVLNRATQRLGTLLHGKYRLDAVLGVGGMAVVYAATHRNQKRFAVKVLHPELSVRSEFRARFLREGYAANSVGHEGVVAVLDDDVDDAGTAFLVMELLHGADVELLCSRSGGKLPLNVVLGLAHQVLSVLDPAHQQAVLHRDLKPANFFVVKSGQVKVLDFGIARLRQASDIQVTRTGAVLGTPAFMAPEQASARSSCLDPRTDLWALGASLFNLLSGQFVHEAENGRQVMIRAATTEARSLSSVMPGLPASVVALVDRALRFDAAARFQSAAAMSEAVLDAHRELFGELTLEPLRACVEGFGAPRYAERPSTPSSSAALALGKCATTAAPPAAFATELERLVPSSRARVGLTSAQQRGPRRGRWLLGLSAAVLGAAALVRALVSPSAPSARVVVQTEAAAPPATAQPDILPAAPASDRVAAAPPPPSDAPGTAPHRVLSMPKAALATLVRTPGRPLKAAHDNVPRPAVPAATEALEPSDPLAIRPQ